MISFLGGCVFSTYKITRLCQKAMKAEEKLIEKNSINFKIMYNWLKGYQTGRKITDILEREKINEIAIYGMGDLGRTLLKELENTDISVKYVIDRNNYRSFGAHSCYSPFDDLPDVQAVIVTPVSDFENIAEQLRKKTEAHLIPLNKVIDQL